MCASRDRTQASLDAQVRARVRRSLTDFVVLTGQELQIMFKSIDSGDGGLAQIEGFVAFYKSDGSLDAAKHKPQVRACVRACMRACVGACVGVK